MPFTSSGLTLFLFVAGLAVVFIGVGAALPILVKYRLHSSFGFIEGGRRLFSAEGAADRRRAAKGLLIAAAGMPLVFGGVLIGDHERNVPCRDACRAAGHESGRIRRSPHPSAGNVAQDPYRCWCRDGSDQWADEPLPLTVRR